MAEKKEAFRGADLDPGWIRFVSLPGEIERVDEDGKVVASQPVSPEEYMRSEGWTEEEIAHAIGSKMPKPTAPQGLPVGGRR